MFTHQLKTSHPIRSASNRVVLLALLGLPLACDPNPTAPVTTPHPPMETSILPLPVSLSSPFDASQYFPIDVQRAAQQQYCPTLLWSPCSWVTAVQVSNHLYGWRAQVRGVQYPIDMQRAVRDQYGAGYVLGAVGVGIYDWRAVHWSALADKVLPVMPIASDYFYDVTAVRTGLANFSSVLVTTRNWYSWRMTLYGGPSKTFRLLQPLVVFLQSSLTAAQWNGLANSTTIDAYRYNFLDSAIAEYKRAYPVPGSSLPVAIVPFTGNSPGVWNGAADYVGYAVEAPRASSITCPATGMLDSLCSDATYAIGHELGHAFGLQHSCTAYPSEPNCGQSIMQWGKPQNAILLSEEVATLQNSPLFLSP